MLIKFLERFNNVPNLFHKISGELPKRKLSKFKDFFSNINSPFFENKCYLCNHEIKDVISLDHFIPFNYTYNDDLWNLIPVHKNCNSSKNNKIGSEQSFKYLIERNKLFFTVKETNPFFKPIKDNILSNYDDFKSLEECMISTYRSCKIAGYKQIGG